MSNNISDRINALESEAARLQDEIARLKTEKANEGLDLQFIRIQFHEGQQEWRVIARFVLHGNKGQYQIAAFKDKIAAVRIGQRINELIAYVLSGRDGEDEGTFALFTRN